MIRFQFSRVSLLWKILLSTSVAITLLFGITGLIVQRHIARITSQSLEEEVKASFAAYDSLWRARARMVSSVSLLLSTMSDVRAAFSTGDQATIRDTAGELWARISDENAVFLVADPQGRVIASLGGMPVSSLQRDLTVVRQAAPRFPDQVSGFMLRDGALYQITVTPVYVQSPRGPLLINVLVSGFLVDALVAQRLKDATGGSEFLFLASGKVIASTVNPRATAELARKIGRRDDLSRVTDGVIEYAPLVRPLLDVEGRQIGRLCILRSFEAAAQRMATLQRNIVLIWAFAVCAGLVLTFLLARRIVEPVKELDRAAAEVAHQNYDCRVPVSSEDELGRLARTFNYMAESIQDARRELIRQERISTIGRLSSSIVHDLRNPLAAVYGGAEMMVDTDLPPAQLKRLAGNIYRASRRIQQLLQDLLNVSRGKTEAAELCRLRDVAAAAWETIQAADVRLHLEIPADLEVPLERARMERVFINLMENAVEAMNGKGDLWVRARFVNGSILAEVQDSGPGIAPEIRDTLFQPFVSKGKKTGLGLGLALSRQTLLDHGGDLWVESPAGGGACFAMRLPAIREHEHNGAGLDTSASRA